MYSFSYLELVCCSMSSSNCCFLTCIQISQEANQVVLYSHLLKNFPQFVVIYTVKGCSIVNEAEVNVFFWNFPAFSIIQWMLAIWSLVSLPLDFPGGSDSKESACNGGDLGLIPGSWRFPEEGNGNPLQYCCLENSIDRRACQATVYGVAKSWTWLSNFHFTSLPFLNPAWTCGSFQFKYYWSLHWRI